MTSAAPATQTCADHQNAVLIWESLRTSLSGPGVLGDRDLHSRVSGSLQDEKPDVEASSGVMRGRGLAGTTEGLERDAPVP